jgi:hypothetical protein
VSIESTVELLRESSHLLTERELDDNGPYDRAARQDAARASRRVWAALALAKDVNTFDALVRGERVPTTRLDPYYIRRLEAWT